MRPIRIAAVLTIATLVPVATAQQTSTTASANSKQQNVVTQPPGPIIGGDGMTNYIPIWAKPDYLLSSIIYQTNGFVGVGTTSPVATLDVNGGLNADNYEIGGHNVLAIGSAADQNLFLGIGAGSHDVAGQGVWNTFTGANAGQSNTTGNDNTFTGYNSGANNTTGYANTFVGFNAGRYNITGNSNTFTGFDAGPNNTGSSNTFTGYEAGYADTTGYANTYLGTAAGYTTSTGGNNTFTGLGAGYSNTTGGQNSYYGVGAGALNVTGNDNTVLGYYAGANSTAGNNDIYLGNLGCASPCTESSTIRIGGDNGQGYGPQTATYVAGIYGVNVSGVPVQINSNGQLGAATSSLRFKEQVQDMGESTDALMKLRPVTFFYKPDYANDERTLQYGLIAEEVAKVYPELVANDKDGQPYSVRYQYLSTMLLNEVQKQYRRAQAEAEQIKAQQREIESLRQQLQLQNANLQERLSKLEKLVETQVNTAQMAPEGMGRAH